MPSRSFIKLIVALGIIGIALALTIKPKEPEYKTLLKELIKDAPTLLPSNSLGYTIKHKGFALSYSEEHEQAEWVAYPLSISDLKKNTKRTDKFREDDDIKTGSASLADYRKSGYDRGHLCPSADRTISYAANNETFLMSNMSPQAPQFNRGIWKKLEERTRKHVRKDSLLLYIVTGPVLEDSLDEIGPNGVDIPNYFYKIMYQPGLWKASAYLFPNKGSKLPLDSFVVSIDSIENVTGIDFFEELPKRKQKVFESTATPLW